MKKKKKLHISSVEKFAYVFLGLLCFTCVFPFVISLMASITDEKSLSMNGYRLIPKEFSVEAYRILLTSYGKTLFKSLGLTISTGLLQPIINIFLSMCMAYPLSQADFKGRNFWRIFLLITMLFSGGMIPGYILYTRYLGMRNNIMVYLLPGLGAWNIFLYRTFFTNIDKSMVESAKIDGANKLRIVLSIMLPLVKPLAVMNFFSGFLSRWNDITTPIYYVNNPKLYPIQYLLQSMLVGAEEMKKLIEMGLAAESEMPDIPIQSTRFALAVIGALPVFILFPYLQKYYAKGIMVGSTKG